ncbi:MAG TPA: hypothetical protein VFU47_14305 [Armatimonadota bacterium]|nr:hypothetical protein [Armatimonadota bacterium]
MDPQEILERLRELPHHLAALKEQPDLGLHAGVHADVLEHAVNEILSAFGIGVAEPLDTPERVISWADVVPGDRVQAPDGTWYEVDSAGRVGPMVSALLKTNGGAARTKRRAADRVTVKRGPTGLVLETFRSAGFNVEVLAG